jgi:acyl-CoA thioesterase
MAAAYFERIDVDRYRPTEQAGGAWNPGEIHFSPLGGLIVHAIDLHRAATPDSKQLARISFDILGYLASDEITIDVRTLRPGRTIELVEATVTIGGRAAVLARAWFLDGSDTSAVAGGEPERLPDPAHLESATMAEIWTGGYVASLDVRAIGDPVPGRTTAWLHSDVALVDGEDVSATAGFVTLVDTANGIAVRESPSEWVFPNVDLTIHFHRAPAGNWVGLDTTVIFGESGLGLTSSVLHDERGAVGRAEQILTVRSARP